MPAAFVTVDSLPLSSNGKLDRAALRALEAQPEADAPYSAPSTATEKVLAGLWAQVLTVDRVGVDDDFFSLGGDSLLAAVLFARTARQTGRPIPLSLLFRGPTIREVARALDEDDVHEESSVVPLRASGSRPPLFMAHGVWHLVRRLDPEQPVYGLQPRTEFVLSRRRLRIEELADRYVEDILRMQASGPYRFFGFCFGGLLVVEVAHRLEQLGHAVDALAMFDARLPGSRPASRARTEAAQLAALIRRDETATEYLHRRSRNAKAKTRDWVSRAKYQFHGRTGRPVADWDELERAQALYGMSRALASYVAPTTQCTVTLYRAGNPKSNRTEVRLAQESDGAGECYVIDGPGVSHATLLEEPHVSTLVEALAELLRRADADAGVRHGSPTTG